MDVMTKIADRHNFVVLFHEKPFAGINGSGKHNNWSLSTDTGSKSLASWKYSYEEFTVSYIFYKCD